MKKTVSNYFLVFAFAAFLIGCSSQKETLKEKTIMKQDQPVVSSPVEKNDTLRVAREKTDVGDSTEYLNEEQLLSKAKEHLTLAEKSFVNRDTIEVARQCELALRLLDRLSYHPNIDANESFNSLSQQLVALYKKAAIPVDKMSNDMSLFRDRIGDDISSIDISTRTFTPPPPTTIPLPLNEPVEQNIIYFTTTLRHIYTKWLERSARYFPMMKEILREEGIPEEMVFLSMIESGVNPTARSWAKCVGLWQFLKSTGEMYGLRGDWYFDDRRNPEKATRAAARHLRDLYNRYNDWQLVLAAYNAGAGRIDRALSRCDSTKKTYWNIRSSLPKETQNYVPIYTAAAIIGLNPAAYDFTDIQYEEPFDYETVKISKCVNVSDLARSIDMTVDDFYSYNPHLLQSTTPPNTKNFELKIPKGKSDRFAQALESLPEIQRPLWITHRVKRGETIKTIVRRYGVSPKVLLHANNMRRVRKLRRGELIRIPIAANSRNNGIETAIDNQRSKSKRAALSDPLSHTKGRQQLTHQLQKDETLGSVAKRYQVTVADLMIWNSLGPNDQVKSGQNLTVWIKPPMEASADSALALFTPPPDADHTEELPLVKARAVDENNKPLVNEYKVKRGETLASIANAFNVTIEKLREWNALRSEKVMTGKVLKIYSEEKIAGKVLIDSTAVAKNKPIPVDPAPVDAIVVKKNETSHTVKSGETLWNIAQKYGLKVEQLKDWNDLESESIQAGQALALRPELRKNAGRNMMKTSITSSESKPLEYYIAQDGETLWSISHRFNCSVDDLVIWNKLLVQTVVAGAKLRVIPPESNSNEVRNSSSTNSSSNKNETHVNQSSPLIHVVRIGDKLAVIARKYEVSIDSVQQWNHLKGEMIRIGQKIFVSSPFDVNFESREMKTYIVLSGDTYYKISRKVNVTVEDLQKWNNGESLLRPGDKLIYY